MNYKKKIIEMLDKVQKEDTLKRVYKLLEYLYIREDLEMDRIKVKELESEVKNMAIKIPITIIKTEKPEPVQQFKVEMPENEYSEPIKFKVNVTEEKQEVTKLIMKEE